MRRCGLHAGRPQCFVPLLPPKEQPNREAACEPLAAQLAHAPHPASVVCLSELLMPKPGHPVECIGTALARLSPTCRTLWATPWICDKLAAANTGDAEASAQVRSVCCPVFCIPFSREYLHHCLQ